MLFSGERPVLGTTSIAPSNASDDALTINLLSGQTGKAIKINNSAGTAVFSVDPVGADTSAGVASFTADTPAHVPVTINAAALQTADLLDFKNSGGTVVADVTSAGNFVAPAFVSTTASPAAAGQVRLASGDAINWRNNAGAADISLTKSGAAAGTLPADMLVVPAASAMQSPAYISSTASPAATGILRLATGDAIAFRNAANTGDVTLIDAGAAAAGTGNLADLLKHAAGFQGAAYVDTSAAPAQSGVLAVGNAVTAVAARNQAGSGDIALLASNTSNRAVLAAATLTASVAGASSLNIPAGTAPTTPAVGDFWFDSAQASLAEGQVSGAKVFKSGVLSVAGAQAANTTITTAQTMFSFTLPAGIANVLNKTLRVSGAGVYTTAAAQTPQITIGVKIGASVTPVQVQSAATTASATNMPFDFQFDISTAAVGAAGNDEAHGLLSLVLGTAPAAAAATYLDTNTAVSANYDHTAANALAVQITASSTLSSATLRQVIIELLN